MAENIHATVRIGASSISGVVRILKDAPILDIGPNTSISVVRFVPLSCAECGTTVAEVIGGSLLIQARHHGEKHKTLIPLARLMDVKNTLVL